ncbi:PHB depolymerase family esterase [Actinocorallia lasiicapitis]
MNKRWVGVVVAVLLLVVGGASAARAEAGTVRTGSLTFGGWERNYRVHVPDKAGPRARLVVALHGGVSDGESLRRESGLDAVADREGFVVAYPDGVMGTWNAGTCCAFAKWFGIDDVGFIDALTDRLAAQGLVDGRRISLAGFSNGGAMAYRYACERPRRVAAVAVASGALGVGCKPEGGISVLAFHGTNDFAVPYHGGGNQDSDTKLPFPPVQWLMDFWRWIDGVPAFGQAVDRGSWTWCRSAGDPVRIEFCTVIGGGHQWPAVAGERLAEFFRTHR